MPYITGSAADYSALLTALRNGCTSNGYTLTGNVLSKGTLYVNTEVSNTSATGNGMPRFLVRPSNNSGISDAPDQRFGLGHYDTTAARGVQFPCTYHLFVHDDPDEVYMVVVYNTNQHQWLAFGQSPAPGIPGTGNWAGGTLGCSTANTGNSIVQVVTGDLMSCNIGYNGGGSSSPSKAVAALAWSGQSGVGATLPTANFSIHAGDIGQGSSQAWLGRLHYLAAVINVEQLIQHTPSTWSQEGVLIPISPTYQIASNIFIVGRIKHARYFNIVNVVEGQILTLGSDQWKSFPWYLKGAGITSTSIVDHTKGFGWAIRYDGA